MSSTQATALIENNFLCAVSILGWKLLRNNFHDIKDALVGCEALKFYRFFQRIKDFARKHTESRTSSRYCTNVSWKKFISLQRTLGRMPQKTLYCINHFSSYRACCRNKCRIYFTHKLNNSTLYSLGRIYHIPHLFPIIPVCNTGITLWVISSWHQLGYCIVISWPNGKYVWGFPCFILTSLIGKLFKQNIECSA